ncbi:MAG: cupin domain-containing protein [Burkholderiaceae bacterium]
MNLQRALPWLGGLSPNTFMREYWQKKPLFVKGAFRDAFSRALPVDEAAFRLLCGHPELAVRLVKDSGSKLAHGPFKASQLPRSKASGWAMLIQQVNTAVPEATAFLEHFRFIPDARLEDLMVSLAGPNGGIGPHVDSYDVFLVQAAGTRDWSIAREFDPAFVEDIPLRVLSHYAPEETFHCEPGDLLYLPPNIAHHGVATSAGCITYSVGFRAPDPVEIADEAVGLKLDALEALGWSDPWLKATQSPSVVPQAMMEAMIQAARQCLPSDAELARSALLTLSRLHPAAQWPTPGNLSVKAFGGRLVRGSGCRLGLSSGARIIRFEGLVAANGEALDLSALKAPERKQMLQCIQKLAEERVLDLPPAFWQDKRTEFIQIFHQLHQAGVVVVLSKSTRAQRTKRAMITDGTE